QRIELPAPIARATHDRSGTLLATVTQDGRAFVVDLGDASVTQLHLPSIHDVAWLSDGFVACASAQSVEIVRVAAEPPSASDTPAVSTPAVSPPAGSAEAV